MYQYFQNQSRPKKADYRTTILQTDGQNMGLFAEKVLSEAENIFCWRVRISGGQWPIPINEWHILADKK